MLPESSPENVYFGFRDTYGIDSQWHGPSKLRPFGSGFLIFSGCLRPTILPAALMQIPVTYMF
jgi:transketolase